MQASASDIGGGSDSGSGGGGGGGGGDGGSGGGGGGGGDDGSSGGGGPGINGVTAGMSDIELSRVKKRCQDVLVTPGAYDQGLVDLCNMMREVSMR